MEGQDYGFGKSSKPAHLQFNSRALNTKNLLDSLRVMKVAVLWKVKVPYQIIDTASKNELSKNYEKIEKYQKQNYYHDQWKPEYENWVMILGWSLHPDD